MYKTQTAPRNAKRSFGNADLKMPLIHSFPCLDFNIKHVIDKYCVYIYILFKKKKKIRVTLIE